MAPLIARSRAGAGRSCLGGLMAFLLVTGCASDEPEAQGEEGSALVPTFEPEPAEEEPEEATDASEDTDSAAPDDASGTDEAPAAAGDEDAPAPTDESEAHAEEPAEDEAAEDQPEQDADDEPASPEVVRSSVTDPQGDTTSPLLGSAPEWADLVGGAVERTGTGDVTLTLVLAAEPEPPRGGTMMNVAAFHDLTGDGNIDLEVWANWSADGWFPSWRDNLDGVAAYGDDTGIEVLADGPELQFVVPAERFDDTTSWRWSMGLEWGRYEWLGTSAAAHDLAPDEGHVDHGP
jgi:hypothetical protein